MNDNQLRLQIKCSHPDEAFDLYTNFAVEYRTSYRSDWIHSGNLDTKGQVSIKCEAETPYSFRFIDLRTKKHFGTKIIKENPPSRISRQKVSGNLSSKFYKDCVSGNGS